MLVGVLAYDRAEELEACLQSITDSPGMEFTLVIHQDGTNPEVSEVINGWRDRALVIQSEDRGGIARGLNRMLAHRKHGEDFVRVDGDTRLLTPEWLRKLSNARRDYGLLAPLWTGNRYEQDTRDFLAGTIDRTHIDTNLPVGGIVFHPGSTVNLLGGYRNHGKFYGCQERDYAARVQGLGRRIAYVTSVQSFHPPTPVVRGERRAELEDALKVFARAEERYARGEDLFQAI